MRFQKVDIDKTIIGAECGNRDHDGLRDVLDGARLPDSTFGNDAAFVAFLLEEYDTLVEDLKNQVEHFAVKNDTLRDAIKKHRAAQGHEMCHENDDELYAVLNDDVSIDRKTPPRCEFRQKCREYYESRPGAEKLDDGW